MFQMNNCTKLFWNRCTNVEVMAQTSSIYDHFIIWTPSKTLNFNLPEQMFQMNNCVKLFWNPCIKFISYSLDKLKLWPFSHLTFKCDLDLQPTWTKVSNEQLCQIILKSMHKCTGYGSDKLNLWPFYHLTFQYDLDFQPTWTKVSISNCAKLFDLSVWHWPSTYLNKCFKWHFYPSRRTTVPDYFKIHAQMYKLWPRQAQSIIILSFDFQVWPWPST